MNRSDLIVSDIAAAFGPKDAICYGDNKQKWCAVPYTSSKYKGTLLTGEGNAPGQLSFDPKLLGWYKIYVSYPVYPANDLVIKLSDDECFSDLCNTDSGPYSIDEVFWRCADMTGQSVIISREPGIGRRTVLSGLRFEPMSEQELAEYKADLKRTDTKALYVSECVHMCKDTDVEWYAPEIQSPEAMSEQLKIAHSFGIKMSVSSRLGYWGTGYPHTIIGQGDPFIDSHPEWRCVDRNGDVISAMSYAYPEVRRYKINIFVEAAKCGADAVTVMACRGIPFVLFEKPVVDMFFERYNEYPFEYPLDNKKLREIHCSIMTTFMCELREALDKEFGKNKVGIHLRGLNSIEDCAYVGFDVKKLVEEGLLDVMVTHDRSFYELLPPEILKNGYGPDCRIDIDKYNEYIVGDEDTTVLVWSDYCYDQHKNSLGEIAGPVDYGHNVRQWREFSDKYGVKVFFEMAGFCNNNTNMYNHLMTFYENGGTGVSIFNTSCVCSVPVMWNLLTKVGHRELIEREGMYPGGYNCIRILTVGDCSYNRYKPMWGG